MSDGMGTDSRRDGTSDGGVEQSPSDAHAALVQIDEKVAIFYGDRLPAGPEFIPFTLLDEQSRASINNALANAAGLGNIAAQAADGAVQAQGLVRLAPQTIEQLRHAAPLARDGWNLGTLASEGKFVAQVRWLPAGGAATAAVLASMGPAITLLAIQFQLNQIADLAQHNLELTADVLKVVRREQWSDVSGYHDSILKELGNARAIGRVTDSIYREVQGYQGPLTSQRDAFEKATRAHVKNLRSKQGHKARQEYLTDHGEAIIADVHALLLAQASWFMYQSLRSGHLLTTADCDPHDAALLKKIVADTTQLHREALQDTDWLLEQLAREFAIIDKLPGQRTFKIGGNARAAKQAASMVRQLQKALAVIRDESVPGDPEPLAIPTTRAFDGPVPPELEQVLPLRLERGERVLALAEATCDRWKLHVRDAGWVCVTDRRLLITKQESFRRVGAIDIELDLQDIRYVRRHSPSDKAPSVDISTTDTDLSLKFPGWAKEDTRRAEAIRFGEVLATFMRLPESEIPTLDIPELAPKDVEQARVLEGGAPQLNVQDPSTAAAT